MRCRGVGAYAKELQLSTLDCGSLSPMRLGNFFLCQKQLLPYLEHSKRFFHKICVKTDRRNETSATPLPVLLISKKKFCPSNNSRISKHFCAEPVLKIERTASPVQPRLRICQFNNTSWQICAFQNDSNTITSSFTKMQLLAGFRPPICPRGDFLPRRAWSF